MHFFRSGGLHRYFFKSFSFAQVKGIEKLGGRVELKSHVQEIVVEGGKAVGVKLRSGAVIRARKAVVSNASIWDTIG